MTTTIQKQILIEADQFLPSEEQWIKGHLGTKRRMCLMGALVFASEKLGIRPGPSPSPYVAAHKAVQKSIHSLSALPTGSTDHIDIALFNDYPKTTFEEVKAVLKDAIDNA